MSMFNKRHYQAVAEAMQEAVRDIRAKEPKYNATDIVDGVNYAIDHLCDTFIRDNSSFKSELFRAACEPGANVRARTVEGAAKGPLTARLTALREAQS